jgi:hypothetical protein
MVASSSTIRMVFGIFISPNYIRTYAVEKGIPEVHNSFIFHKNSAAGRRITNNGDITDSDTSGVIVAGCYYKSITPIYLP